MSTQPLLAAVGAGLAVALLAWAMAAIGKDSLTIYRARFTGFGNRDDAAAMCNQLKKAKMSCLAMQS